MKLIKISDLKKTINKKNKFINLKKYVKNNVKSNNNKKNNILNFNLKLISKKWKVNYINSFNSLKFKKEKIDYNITKVSIKSNRNRKDVNIKHYKNVLANFLIKYKNYKLKYKNYSKNKNFEISNINKNYDKKKFNLIQNKIINKEDNNKIIYRNKIEFSLIKNNKLFLLKNSKKHLNFSNISNFNDIKQNLNYKWIEKPDISNENLEEFKYFLSQIKIGNIKLSIEILKKFPYFISKVDLWKRNCLMWAIIRKHYKLTKILISFNFNNELNNNIDLFKLNCLDYSIKNEDIKLTNWLLLNLFNPLKWCLSNINNEKIFRVVKLSQNIWIKNRNQNEYFNYNNIKKELKKIISIRSEKYTNLELKFRFNLINNLC